MFHGAGTVTLIALNTWVVTALFGANLLIQGKAYRLLVRAVSRRMPTGFRPEGAKAAAPRRRGPGDLDRALPVILAVSLPLGASRLLSSSRPGRQAGAPEARPLKP